MQRRNEQESVVLSSLIAVMARESVSLFTENLGLVKALMKQPNKGNKTTHKSRTAKGIWVCDFKFTLFRLDSVNFKRNNTVVRGLPILTHPFSKTSTMLHLACDRMDDHSNNTNGHITLVFSFLTGFAKGHFISHQIPPTHCTS